MIEGGSSIISSFLSDPEVDLVVTTVAPTLVGQGVDLIRRGVGVSKSFDDTRLKRTDLFLLDDCFADKST